MESKENIQQQNDRNIPVKPEKHRNSALELIWGRYNMWDKTAAYQQGKIRKWRKWVLIATILGAFFGVLSGTTITFHQTMFEIKTLEIASQILAFFSTLFVSLAAFAGSEILSDELEEHGMSARALAETYKSETYLYLFDAAPYDEAEEDAIFERVDKIVANFTQVPCLSITRREELKELPDENMSIDSYIANRIEEQVYNYFNKKVKKLQRNVRLSKNATFTLGFTGVILGSLGTAGFSEYTSVWIAFVTSASGAIAAFVATNRYSYLIISYQTTANRLKSILAKYLKKEKHTKKDTQEFVYNCESELARENKAWIAEQSKDLADEEDLKKLLAENRIKWMKEAEKKFSKDKSKVNSKKTSNQDDENIGEASVG